MIHTWSLLRPVKQNMPIWSVIWDQSRWLPSFFKLFWSATLIEMILSAIPLTSVNLWKKIEFSFQFKAIIIYQIVSCVTIALSMMRLLRFRLQCGRRVSVGWSTLAWWESLFEITSFWLPLVNLSPSWTLRRVHHTDLTYK